MRILVVAPQPFFTPRGTPFSVYYRTRVTCELGHQVDLLTYGQGEDVDIPGCRIVRTPAFKFLGAIRIGPSLLKLFHDCFMIIWTIAMLCRYRYAAVHAHEEAVFWCRWLKPVFRFALVYDMHSSLPQQLDNFSFSRSRVLHGIFRWLEKSSVRSADGVIAVCPALERYARTLCDRPEKVVLIENSLSDPVRFPTRKASVPGDRSVPGSERNEAAERWLRARNPRRVIAYAGTLEAYQGIDRLLDAFSVVLRRVPEAGLVIVGGMPREVEQLRALADSLHLGDSVLFTGQVSQPEAQRLVSLVGAAISPRFSGNNTPMKIYQLMAAGIPVVATRIDSHTQVLNDDIALLAEPNAGAISDAIITLLQDHQAAAAMAARAQDWYRQKYAREAYAGKLQQLLSTVT